MRDVSGYAWVTSTVLLWCGLKSWTLRNSITWAARKGNDFDHQLRKEVPRNLQEQVGATSHNRATREAFRGQELPD